MESAGCIKSLFKRKESAESAKFISPTLSPLCAPYENPLRPLRLKIFTLRPLHDRNDNRKIKWKWKIKNVCRF
jgi:hypothetical protein